MNASTENASSSAPKTHKFQAEVSQVLKLVIHSLYTSKEIFLRELLSNASDALDKLRFRAVTDPDVLGSDPTLEIRIRYDKAKRTLSIEDTGIGMTEEELVTNLGTVAHSGSRALLEKLAEASDGKKPDLQLIGQFGVGFYSAYLVADRVEVITRAVSKGERALRWTSDAHDTFTIEPGQRGERGTEVILHLREDQAHFLDDWEIRSLVQRYSDYVAHPIRLEVHKKDGDQEKRSFEQLNRGSALWQRPKSEVTKEQYEELYRHLTHDLDAPLSWTHFKVEGTQEFVGLVYIPRRAPLDLFDVHKRRGLRLFVKRVFIMEDCDEVLPPWLRFVRGVVDSDDLPLNVSRELLQDSSILRSIKKQVVKRSLDLLDEMAKERPDDYAVFWKAFGAVMKEGLALDHDANKERIGALCRYESSRGGLVSLDEYIGRMPEKQDAIYYVFGESLANVAGSPHAEAIRSRGFELLYMIDPVDEFAVDGLGEYKGKKLVSAMRADLSLDQTDEEKREAARLGEGLKPLFERMKKTLEAKIKDVRVSERLTDSPSCLVLDANATPAFMERLFKERGRAIPHQKRILEVNAMHPLVQSLATLAEKAPESEELDEWIEVLYDQAVLTEGGAVEDPNRFARRVATLLTLAADKKAASVTKSDPTAAARPRVED
jgi:molecular chaperone HtpG